MASKTNLENLINNYHKNRTELQNDVALLGLETFFISSLHLFL